MLGLQLLGFHRQGQLGTNYARQPILGTVHGAWTRVPMWVRGQGIPRASPHTVLLPEFTLTEGSRKTSS